MSSRTSLPTAQVFFFKSSRVRKVIADHAVFGNWKPSDARMIVRWLMTWLESSRYGSVIYYLGRDWRPLSFRRVLRSGSLHRDGGCRLPGRQWTRSDGVHELLKTNGMITAPQFQLQRTSRGWVRIKKQIPSDTNRGAGMGA